MKINEKKNDFSSADLPSSYKELFIDRISHEWRKMLLCGFLVFLFAIPFLAVFFVKDVYASYLLREIGNGSLTRAEANALSVRNQGYLDVILIVATPIFGIGLSGATRIFRNLSWLEPVFSFGDFGMGMKKEGLNEAIVFLIYGFLLAVSLYVLNTDISAFVRYVPISLCQLVLLPTLFWHSIVSSIYRSSFLGYLSLSFRLFVRFFGQNIILIVLSNIPILFFLIPNLMWKYAILVTYFVFFMPLFSLGWFIFSNSLLDKAINKTEYPELVRKGLWKGKEKN